LPIKARGQGALNAGLVHVDFDVTLGRRVILVLSQWMARITSSPDNYHEIYEIALRRTYTKAGEEIHINPGKPGLH